ncbi:hypothetical protein MRX96_018488 [Rhipicephalus microplus]
MSGVNLHHHRRNSIYIITAGEGEREARTGSLRPPLPSPPPFMGLDPLTNGTKATTPVPAGPVKRDLR